MDSVRTLLHEARQAGLMIRADGDQLVVRGPRKAEALALELIRNKPAVIAALCESSRSSTVYGTSTTPEKNGGFKDRGDCYWCRRRQWWRSVHGVVVCGNCHPPVTLRLVVEWLEPKDN